MRTNRFRGRTALIRTHAVLPVWRRVEHHGAFYAALEHCKLAHYSTVDGAFKDDGLQPGQRPFVFCWTQSLIRSGSLP